MRPFTVSLIVLACLALPLPARAVPFTIGVADATIPAGGTGTVDVTITGSPGDNLNDFAVQFLITGGGGLQFTSDLGNPGHQPTGYYNDSAYVFAGNSGFQQNGFAPALATTSATNDTVNGGDFTADNVATGFTAKTPTYLLERLTLTADMRLTPGTTFTVSLNFPSDAAPQSAGNPTDFNDQSETPQPYDSTSGTITIGQPAAVPEPSGIVLATVAGACLLGSRKRRHRALANGQFAGSPR